MGTLVFVCPTTGHEVSSGFGKPSPRRLRIEFDESLSRMLL